MILFFKIFLLLFSFSTFANSKSICGYSDDRILSDFSPIGRTVLDLEVNFGACTATMIGRSCAISAGHCYRKERNFIEFNIPLSDADGKMNHPSQDSIYLIDWTSLKHRTSMFNDYAVFKVLPNAKTGLYAGDVQGFMKVSFDTPSVGSEVRLSGYGKDFWIPTRNNTQKTITDYISRLQVEPNRSLFYYKADTTGGDSGAAIVLENSQEIVGVNTTSGCSDTSGENRGTLISHHEEFMNAIRECLEQDSKL